MAGNTVIIVAQAETGAAAGEHAPAAAEESHAPGAEGETHATTGHAAEGGHSDVFPPFDPAGFTGQLIWLAITFAALYVVMSRVALPRIGGILEQRRVRIEGDLKEADRLRLETERAVQAYESALAEARSNAQKIAQETSDSIKADIAGKRAGVEADLARKMAEAEARINQTKNAALANVGDIAAETAQALVAQLGGQGSFEEARAAVATAAGRTA